MRLILLFALVLLAAQAYAQPSVIDAIEFKLSNYTVSESAGSATAGSDYIATSGTLTFNPGTTTQSITVTVKGDNALEQNETFSVNLASPVNASLADGTGIGTIVNDDGFPRISVHNENVREGDAENVRIEENSAKCRIIDDDGAG